MKNVIKVLFVLILSVNFIHAKDVKCQFDKWHSIGENQKLIKQARNGGREVALKAMKSGKKISTYDEAKSFCIQEVNKLNLECEHARFFVKFCSNKFDL